MRSWMMCNVGVEVRVQPSHDSRQANEGALRLLIGVIAAESATEAPSRRAVTRGSRAERNCVADFVHDNPAAKIDGATGGWPGIYLRTGAMPDDERHAKPGRKQYRCGATCLVLFDAETRREYARPHTP